jgi:hypothetical protein
MEVFIRLGLVRFSMYIKKDTRNNICYRALSVYNILGGVGAQVTYPGSRGSG